MLTFDGQGHGDVTCKQTFRLHNTTLGFRFKKCCVPALRRRLCRRISSCSSGSAECRGAVTFPFDLNLFVLLLLPGVGEPYVPLHVLLQYEPNISVPVLRTISHHMQQLNVELY